MNGAVDATLPARLRAGRYEQVDRELDRIACAVAELRDIIARMRAADERREPE